MIINESLNFTYYRYTDEVYQVGDIIRGFTPQSRKLNSVVVDTYQTKCNYDFKSGYVYMSVLRNDPAFDSFNYCYEVKPIGPVLIGNDDYSIDLCNDYINNDSRHKFIDNKYIINKASTMADQYINSQGDIMSAISHSCKVVRVFNLSGGDVSEVDKIIN